jgi:hypothetical protein
MLLYSGFSFLNRLTARGSSQDAKKLRERIYPPEEDRARQERTSPVLPAASPATAQFRDDCEARRIS